MKYPQLVSTRAVNAISDWLVSRLEQLGVEAPQIYTRLLLSLLQSSVHINDPIEFSSLETFIVNRKGGGSIRRFLQFDANTLKKLNAIQCLSEIVSPEQELTSIESLVDELWEKLKDIEKQTDRNDGGIDDTILIDAPINKTKADLTVQEATVSSPKRAAIFCKTLNSEKASTKIVVADHVIAPKSETETDPKKRYFNAFPALSKEMEDSFRIWRQNAKSLTWPANRCNSSSAATASKASTGIMSNAFGSVASDRKSVKAESIKNDELLCATTTNSAAVSHLNNFHNHANVTSTSGLKRKTKRRKSQSMSKGRTLPNMRKGGSNNENFAAGQTAGRKANRHMSPTQWDTDFDGYWEMGRDLIKEFFAKQGDRNRNRCNSEGSVHHLQTSENQQKQKLQAFEFNELAMNCNKTATAKATHKDVDDGAQTPQLMPQVDISFCYDENADDDDTFKSISELTADSSLNALRSSPRRLYQRLVIAESVGTNQNDNIQDDQTDFVQFKAKFTSNIAALWEDVSDEEHANSGVQISTASGLWSAPNDIPWQSAEPIKESLKNFWSIFNNHPLDFAKIIQQQQQHQNETPISNQIENKVPNSKAYTSLPFDILVASVQDDNANFVSIPDNLEGIADIANGVNNKRNNDGRITPIGVFLQDSIWSENLNGGKNTDTDESFYLKVWNSNKKLYNLDAVYEAKLTEASDDSKINSSSSSASFQYYGNSKWSEGINAGPTLLQQQFQQQQQQQLEHHKNSNRGKKNNGLNEQNVNSVDCVDTSMPTTASSSSCSYMQSSSGVFSGQTPSLQSSQHSWHADKKVNSQTSLTDIYGMSSPAHNDNRHREEQIDHASLITLPNHSTESSGFSDYSRIKSIAKTLGQDNVKQQQLNYQAQRSAVASEQLPHYADDENLLTSERTHFQPIKAYADGYTFDVCSALDVINYRRSESGYLYYESHKYLEYTRSDNYMAEDETSTAGVSAAPLYAGSNCEAAVARKQKKERKDDELVLKFRIMNREMACQTDDEETVMRNMYAAQMHPLYLIFSGASTDGIKIPTTGQACSDAIEALNRAVAAAAKAAADRDRTQLERSWRGLHEVVGSGRNVGVDQSHLWTTAQATPHDDIGGDEIDFCNESSCSYVDNALEQQWSSMQRCKIMGIGDVDLTTGSSGNANAVAANTAAAVVCNASDLVHNVGELHTLWGVCAACSGEYKEAPPANHLLRDELNLEADEIMSDLKNMQDLYIGTEGGSGVDLGNELDWQFSNADVNNEVGIRHPMAVVGNKTQMLNVTSGADNDALENWNEIGDLELRQKETQQKVLQQVNKLIANLMRPERANDTNVLADTAASAHRELGESLWPDDGEHSIWKNQSEMLRDDDSGFGSNDLHEKLLKADACSSVLRAEEKQFLSQLRWEHDNLAELWAKQTPPITPPQQQQKHKKPPPATSSVCSTRKNSSAKQDEFDSCVCVANENPKNIGNETKETSKSVADLNPDVKNSSAANKRIQQFLSSNSCGVGNNVTTAKVKLANRKRRHSASQNYEILHGGGGSVLGDNTLCGAASINNHKSNTLNAANNNNNIKISDLNNINIKRNTKLSLHSSVSSGGNGIYANFDFLNTSDTCAVFSDDVDMEQGFYDPSNFLIINNNHNNVANVSGANGVILPPKQTIITCKYWATIDPMVDSTEDTIDCNEDGDGITTATFSCLVHKNDSLLKHVNMLSRPLTR